MRILVIGGSYFLGKCFVNMAYKEHELFVFNRASKPLELPGVVELTGDRSRKQDLAVLSQMDFDVIVDFCAYNKADIQILFDEIPMEGKQYIWISTSDIYERNLGCMLQENGPLEKRIFSGEAGDYIAGKVGLEQEVPQFAEALSFFYTSIRPAFIYGPNNYAPRESIYFHWIREAGQILHPIDATGQFQLVYVEDVAKAILVACGNREAYNQGYNLTPQPMVTYESFHQALKCSVETDYERIPLRVADVMEKNIPLPFPLTEEESNWYDGRKACALIGQYTSLEEGMRRTVEWYNEVMTCKL